MMNLNTPWVESPFFEEELEKRNHLSDEQKEQIRFYHKNGYLILKNLVDEEFIQETIDRLEENNGANYHFENPRAIDLWKELDCVKQIAIQNKVMELLELLYDREPIPFQTLNFKYGSRQKAHSDSIHFNCFPPKFMAACWVALEDMDENNGPVTYYPGSHKLQYADYSHLTPDFDTAEKPRGRDSYIKYYEPFVTKLMEVNSIEPEYLTIKKGDALIWSSNLIHGGSPVKDQERTRWSQVTHYFFKDCLYYTPIFSNPVSGEWSLRQIYDVRTGEQTWGSYNGYVPKPRPVPGSRYLLSEHASSPLSGFRNLFVRAYYKFFKS